MNVPKVMIIEKIIITFSSSVYIIVSMNKKLTIKTAAIFLHLFILLSEPYIFNRFGYRGCYK